MPTVHVNGIDLYYEVTGNGFPLVFSHEFAGDHRSWEPQVRFFSRRYQVITYNNRGYPPSEVPTDPAAYSEDIVLGDLCQLLRHLKISKAHIAGLSMGGNLTLNFGFKYPERCSSLVIAGCGAGSRNREQFKKDVKTILERLTKEGMKEVADFYSQGPTRVQFRRKDPRGWQEFREQFANHSALGSALTFRGLQLQRPSIFELEAELRQLQPPTLLLIGDEDEPCIESNIFMKRLIPHAGLVILPQSGHTLNLEEPDLFNRAVLDFLIAVEAGKWAERDPVSVPGAELLPPETER
jgi:pimeloyl-ACP methyl ester carboxylesterase